MNDILNKPIPLAWSNLEGTKFVSNAVKFKHPDCVLPLYDNPFDRQLSDDDLNLIIKDARKNSGDLWPALDVPGIRAAMRAAINASKETK
jgi:hypothetical protein